MDASKILQRLDSFASNLSKKDRIAVIFHTDADGICSGIIASKTVERICGKKPVLHLQPEPSEVTISEKMVFELKKRNVNKVIVTDLNVDQEPGRIKAIEKFAEILILDHHEIRADLNSQKTIMIKPQMLSKASPSKYPASKLAYDMFSRHCDISDLAWLAAIGIYGDVSEAEWREFISETLEKSKIGEGQISMAGALIVYARSYDEANGPINAFDALYSANSISDVLKSKLLDYSQKIEEELAYYIEKRHESAQIYPEKKLLIYEIRPKYSIKSELSNRLSRTFYPDWTCVIMQLKGETAGISARNQSGGVSMNDLMIRATKGIPDSSGGGHIQAAGASFPNIPKWVSEFKKRVLEAVG